MRGNIILSHGFESGPEATKTSAMAAVAESLGWHTERPDYRDLDAQGLAASVAPRCARLLELAGTLDGPLVLAGSSMGSFVSGLVSQQVPCIGLFLLALPVSVPEFAEPFAMASGVPVTLVHGFADETCPADATLDFARRHGAHVLMVADEHRLAAHVGWIAEQFGLYLRQFDQSAPRPAA